MFICNVEKDKDNVYTSIGEHLLAHCNLPPYHADNKWDVIPDIIHMPENMRHDLHEIETICLKKRQPISCTGLWMPSDKLLHVVTHRKPTPCGGFKTVEYVRLVDDMYDGWPRLLNQHLQVLVLPSGKHLTRKDLSVLHFFTMGLPRKMIAASTQTSVKSVEKRLSKIKDLLFDPRAPTHGLRHSLHVMNLVPFVLAEPDWFAIEERLVVHSAHNLDFDK